MKAMHRKTHECFLFISFVWQATLLRAKLVERKPAEVVFTVDAATVPIATITTTTAAANTDDNNLDDDYVDEKEALESFDRIIEEESKLINETDILHEEELVELKERCVKLTDDNIALRHEIENLRLSTNKQFQMLVYTASLAAFIGYIFSIFFS